jgi:hypothetical protein
MYYRALIMRTPHVYRRLLSMRRREMEGWAPTLTFLKPMNLTLFILFIP